METNKSNLLGLVIAVCAGVLASIAVLMGLQKVSTLNVNVNADKPVNVSVKGGDVTPSEDELVGANAGEVTYWISGDFSDDLNVQDTLTTVGANITGNVTSTSLVTSKRIAFTSSASSQTLCSIRNTTGADRVLAFADLIYATTTATGGSYRLTVSQSATASATGTGAQLYFDGFVSAPTNGINNLVPTSTLSGTNGVRDIWKAGNYINYLIASPTTTLAGTCLSASN